MASFLLQASPRDGESQAVQRTQAVVEFFRSAAKKSEQVLASDFQTAASELLGISDEDALDLAYQLDFEGGCMMVPGALLTSPPRKTKRRGVLSTMPDSAMRPLYYDTIFEYAKAAQAQMVMAAQEEEEEEEGEGEGEGEDFDNYVAQFATDLLKQCNLYAMEVAQFTKVAHAHDLRRSETFKLLKTFGFVGGLAVNPKEKWFDQNGKMRAKFMHDLATTMSGAHGVNNRIGGESSGVICRREKSDSVSPTEFPDWACPDIKSGKSRQSLASAAAAVATISPRLSSQYNQGGGGGGGGGRVSSGITSRRKSSPNFPKVLKKYAKLHINTVRHAGSNSETSSDVVLKTSGSPPLSPNSPSTPDWGASHSWKRKSKR